MPKPDFRDRLLAGLGGDWPEPCPLNVRLREGRKWRRRISFHNRSRFNARRGCLRFQLLAGVLHLQQRRSHPRSASKTMASSKPQFSDPPVTDDGRRECGWLAEAKNQLCAIRHLKEGWDSHEGRSPDPDTLDAAVRLLGDMVEAGEIPKPHINPTPRGGVQFEWEVADRYFEIDVVSGNAVEYLFEDDSAGIVEEGKLFVGEVVDGKLSRSASRAIQKLFRWERLPTA